MATKLFLRTRDPPLSWLIDKRGIMSGLTIKGVQERSYDSFDWSIARPVDDLKSLILTDKRGGLTDMKV